VVIAALVLLAIIALAALLASVGALVWLVKMDGRRTTAFTQMVTSMNAEQAKLMATLVLGYQDSQPPSEPPSTEPSETETPKPDVNSLDDMPDHIRDQYLREAEEDLLQEAMRGTTLSRPSFEGVNLSET
jgi:hypothetical protein